MMLGALVDRRKSFRVLADELEEHLRLQEEDRCQVDVEKDFHLSRTQPALLP